MSSSCMCWAHCSGVRSVRSSVVPYFSCPARLRSWNDRITDATTVSSSCCDIMYNVYNVYEFHRAMALNALCMA